MPYWPSHSRKQRKNRPGFPDKYRRSRWNQWNLPYCFSGQEYKTERIPFWPIFSEETTSPGRRASGLPCWTSRAIRFKLWQPVILESTHCLLPSSLLHGTRLPGHHCNQRFQWACIQHWKRSYWHMQVLFKTNHNGGLYVPTVLVASRDQVDGWAGR